jgi:hypothetical protein
MKYSKRDYVGRVSTSGASSFSSVRGAIFEAEHMGPARQRSYADPRRLLKIALDQAQRLSALISASIALLPLSARRPRHARP